MVYIEGTARKTKGCFDPSDNHSINATCPSSLMILGQPVKARGVSQKARLNRHPMDPSTQKSQTHRVRGQLKREKIGGDGPT